MGIWGIAENHDSFNIKPGKNGAGRKLQKDALNSNTKIINKLQCIAKGSNSMSYFSSSQKDDKTSIIEINNKKIY